MGFRRTAGHVEVEYLSAEDMDPAAQPQLLDAIVRELERSPVSVLFVVNTLDVPRSVPEFWFGVTRQYAPRLCAMAIVSESLAVRASASGFSVTNRVRRVKTAVRSFLPADLELARAWCAQTRAAVATS